MATSYLESHLVAKHGAAARFDRAEARRSLTRGLAALGLAVLISAAMYLTRGKVGLAVLPTFGAAIWLLRAYRFHRQSRAAQQGEGENNPP